MAKAKSKQDLKVTIVDQMSAPQALALVAALIDGKASRQALQVLVGYGGVPDPDEFMSADQAMRARWRKALRVIINSASILTELVDEGEEQSEIEYQYDEEETKKEKAVR